MQKLITIIIPNYNGQNLIKTCLDSIYNQTYQDFEVIVVDDCSTDNSIKILEKYPIKIIKNSKNLGFAASINRGLKEAKTDFVLLLNNDVTLNPNFIELMVNSIKMDQGIFSVSPKMLRAKEPNLIDDCGDNYTIFGWAYKRGDGLNKKFFFKRDKIFSSCAGAGIYRLNIIKALNYFDELHFAYLEDVDLGWKALINGYKNIFEPKAICYHIGSATLADGNKYSENKVYLSSRNNILIIKKNMPLFQIILNSPFLFLGFIIKYFYFKKRGFSQAYSEGLIKGIKQKVNKPCVNKNNLKNYLKIEFQIIKDTITYGFLKFLTRWSK